MAETRETRHLWAADCRLGVQGRRGGACAVEAPGRTLSACEATLREREGRLERLIKSVHLSRPENYLSIYQSGCNFSCRKCHSWQFSQRPAGSWCTAEMLGAYAAAREAGLKNVRAGNIGVFARSREEADRVMEATEGTDRGERRR